MGRAWPSPGEPLFLPADTDGAVALTLDEQMRGPCGQPHDESMDPSKEDAYTVRRIACHACAEKSKAEADMREAEGSDHGIFLHVELTNARSVTNSEGGPS